MENKRMKRYMKISTENDRDMGKNSTKLYIQVISVSNEKE